MAKKYTQEEFLEKVRENNKNDIDYSKFVYDGNNKYGICKCNVCGYEWKTIPMSLFKGHGCPKCAIEYKARLLSRNQDELIKKYKEVHGNTYDYSLVKYVNDKTPIDIICKTHGVFKQRPYNHLKGAGCPKCAKSGVKLTQEEFLSRISEKIPTIDFSNFKYVNCSTPGKCKCNVCGHEWEANYMSLMHSRVGCPKCALKSRTDKRKSTLEDFLKKYNEKFPNSKYDFSKSIYVNALTYMDVICPKHGIFKSRPNDLLNGHGCPVCKESKLEKTIKDFLDEKGFKYTPQMKFEWLKNINKLSLDFYLHDFNIAIECQGEQHFINRGIMTKLDEIKFRDALKKELCKEHGVKLVYYLLEKNNKYMKEDDVYFNNTDELLKIF